MYLYSLLIFVHSWRFVVIWIHSKWQLFLNLLISLCKALKHNSYKSANFWLILGTCILLQEIASALENKCNIIPITENFEWPDPNSLPEDIRQICFFNGIK